MIATQELVVPEVDADDLCHVVLQIDSIACEVWSGATFQAGVAQLDALTVTRAGRRTRSAIV
jgi:hypothetical protein